MPRPMLPSHGETPFTETSASADARNVAAQVLGSAGLPSVIEPQRLDVLPAVPSHEFGNPEAFTEVLLGAHEETITLFDRVNAAVPTLQELENAGCLGPSLAESYERMYRTDMQPEIVIAPINMPLNTFKVLFNAMLPTYTPAFDDKGIPGNPLQRSSNLKINGLSIASTIANEWRELTDVLAEQVPCYEDEDKVRWAVRVAEATNQPLLTAKNYTAVTHELIKPHESSSFLMHIEEYLVMQARCIQRGDPPVDRADHILPFRTWLAGELVSDHKMRLVSPTGSWNRLDGCIEIETSPRNVWSTNLGARQVEWSRNA